MNTQKVQIEVELLLNMISLVNMVQDDIYKSDDDFKIMTFNNVHYGLKEKLNAMKAREVYQKYQEAKNNGNKYDEHKYLKEYNKIRNNC